MKNLAKIGVAAAFVLGGASATLAQDTGVGVGVDAGVNAGVNAGAGGAGAGAGAGVGVDTQTTGSVGNYGGLISSLRAGTTTDLSTYTAGTSINCVAISNLQGEAAANAQALDNALSQNQARVTSLRTDIQGNAMLMQDLEAQCAAQIDDFDVQDIVAVQTDVDGSFTFYIDDRAS
jgi:hypothetical protein